MDIAQIFNEATARLDSDDLFVDQDHKNKYILDEIVAFSKAAQIGLEDGSFDELLLKHETDMGSGYTKLLEEVVACRVEKAVNFKTEKHGSFSLSSKFTAVPQDGKLIMTMKSLCYALGIDTIYTAVDSRMNSYYRPSGLLGYQSASNVILELSSMLAQREAGRSMLENR